MDLTFRPNGNLLKIYPRGIQWRNLSYHQMWSLVSWKHSNILMLPNPDENGLWRTPHLWHLQFQSISKWQPRMVECQCIVDYPGISGDECDQCTAFKINIYCHFLLCETLQKGFQVSDDDLFILSNQLYYVCSLELIMPPNF